MSFHREVSRLRRRLIQLPGYTASPACDFCGQQVEVHAFRQHATQCERDSLSRTIEQLDRALARWWATEPATEAERVELDARAERWRQERVERWNALMATTPDAPGYPFDGMPF